MEEGQRRKEGRGKGRHPVFSGGGGSLSLAPGLNEI